MSAPPAIRWLACVYCGTASAVRWDEPEPDGCRFCVNQVIDCGGFSVRVRDDRVLS